MSKLGWIGQTATIDVLRPKLATVHKLLQVRESIIFSSIGALEMQCRLVSLSVTFSFLDDFKRKMSSRNMSVGVGVGVGV